MRKRILTTILTVFTLFSKGQVKNIELSKINTLSEAESFIAANPKSGAKLFTIESGIDTTEILLPLYQKKSGFSFRIDNYIYKIISADSTLSFRASYIYLSGDKFSKKEIDSLRQEIVAKYKNGTSFPDLVAQYNMDPNITGDTKWFTENMMVKEFENAVRKHKKNEIFMVDTPGQNWYHVVLKTYDDAYIKKLTIIKLNSGG